MTASDHHPPQEGWISTGFTATLPTSNACYGGPSVVSLCYCAALTLPDTWALSWASGSPEEREAAAARFGMDPTTTTQFCAEMEIAFGSTYGWPNVIIDRDAANDLWSRYVRTPGARLLEHGLEDGDVARFLKRTRPANTEPGFSPMGESGMFTVAQRHRPMSDKSCLGYELITWKYGMLGCSWICHGWPEEIANRIGVRQNEYGLLATPEQAAAVRGILANEDENCLPDDWFIWRSALIAER